MITKARILVVEDEAIVAEDLQLAIIDLSYEVVGRAVSANEAVKKAVELKPDLILMDIFLIGEKNGIDASREIKAKMDIPIIFLTAYTDVELVDRAKSTEPYAYIVKPFQERQLFASIEMAMYKSRVERRLRKSEEFNFSLLNNSSNPLIVINPDTSIRYVNPAFELLTGFSSAKLIGEKAPYPWWIEEASKERIAEFKEIIQKGTKDFEMLFQRKDGERFWVKITSTPVKSDGEFEYYLANWVDITDYKKAEQKIKATLVEREVLLKDNHHRVKNNLQIISRMLNQQSGKITDKKVLEIFRETQNRVESMALIHEKLYQSKDMTRIDFADYIQAVASHLFPQYNVDPSVIKQKIDAHDVFMGINTAIPCSLIINELLSNCLKHAFPAGKEGEIRIDLRSDANKKFTLIVSDNGVGFPEDLDFRNTETVGLQLVCTLVEQLEGTIELDRHGGTEFEITFAEL